MRVDRVPCASRRLGLDARRRVVDVEACALDVAGERRRRGVRRRVRRRNPHDVGAVWNRRRVPHENRIPHPALQDSSTRFRLRAGTTRRTAGDRHWRLRPSRRSSAGPSGRSAGRAAAERRRRSPGRSALAPADAPSDVFSSKPAISISLPENGRWKTVPGGMHRHRRNLRPEIAWQISGRHRRQDW